MLFINYFSTSPNARYGPTTSTIPDPTRGAMHFYLPVPEGQKTYQPLRHRLPGWALPRYVVESPQGGGKMLAPS